MEIDIESLPNEELKSIILQLRQALHQTQSEVAAYKEKYASLLEEIRMADTNVLRHHQKRTSFIRIYLMKQALSYRKK